LTNQDFLQYASSEEFVKNVIANKTVDYKKLVEIIPSNPQSNYAFHNEGGLRFKDESKVWGLSKPGFSNGSAYGDLDNDGDMDLVVNNVNMEAFVYRNETKRREGHHYLKLILKGEGLNTNAFGSKVEVLAGDNQYYLEQMPIRGFESSVDPRPNIGLGKDSIVASVKVTWPDGKVTVLNNVKADQTLILDQKDGDRSPNIKLIKTSQPIFETSTINIDYRHEENDFVDFDRDRLIYHMLSCESPRMSTGDFNKDGLKDFYIGGPKDQAGTMFVQTALGSFIKTNEKLLGFDRISEDTGSAVFDADGDGDQDLYVCSGGNEFPSTDSALIDRLYINDGLGNLKKSGQVFPTNKFESSSVVRVSDYDRDGDMDLFVGSRLQSFNYGAPVGGYILSNDGKGNFKDATLVVCPELIKAGMITDAQWLDLDKDKDDDLVEYC
jgi:hypothetical protein